MQLLYPDISRNSYCTLFEPIVGKSLFIFEIIDFDYFEKMIGDLSKVLLENAP